MKLILFVIFFATTIFANNQVNSHPNVLKLNNIFETLPSTIKKRDIPAIINWLEQLTNRVEKLTNKQHKHLIEKHKSKIQLINKNFKKAFVDNKFLIVNGDCKISHIHNSIIFCTENIDISHSGNNIIISNKNITVSHEGGGSKGEGSILYTKDSIDVSHATSTVFIAAKEKKGSFTTNSDCIDIGVLNDSCRIIIDNQISNQKRCQLTQLPKDTKVYYVSSRLSSKTLDYNFKNFNHIVKENELIVTIPKKPIVLVLGSNEATVWKIKQIKDANIVGIIVATHSKQIVMGIKKSIPLLYANFKSRDCPYFESYSDFGVDYYIAKRAIKQITSKEFTQIITQPINNRFYVGNRVDNDKNLFYKDEYRLNPDSFKEDIDTQGSIVSKLNQLIKAKKIRYANSEDIKAWNKNSKIDYIFRRKYMRLDHNTPLVILDKIVLPKGMGGGHSRIFIIPKDVPFPSGAFGHNNFFLIKDGSCIGHFNGCKRYEWVEK